MSATAKLLAAVAFALAIAFATFAVTGGPQNFEFSDFQVQK